MRAGTTGRGAGPSWPSVPPALLCAILGGLATAQAVILALLLGEASPAGAAPPDFVLFWASGAAARTGAAASFYDPAVAKAAEVAAFGRDFTGLYRWVYPPILYLLTAPLSVLPGGLAQAAFTAATFAGFAAVLARIAGRSGLLLAFAWPASLAAAAVGQNGFLTAALLGAGILSLERRPLAAGCLFGLLAFKPHLGLLVPVALLAAGRWPTIGAAAATILVACAASVAAYGPEPWLAFLRALPATGDGLLAEGIMGFGKLQSAYGLARSAGLSAASAATIQAGSALAAAALAWRTWRIEGAPPALRLAALAAGTALATPYLYLYDLPLLGLAAAALLRLGPSRADLAGIGLAVAALLLQPLTGAPTGLAASLVLFGLVLARAFPRRRAAAEWSRPDQVTA